MTNKIISLLVLFINYANTSLRTIYHIKEFFNIYMKIPHHLLFSPFFVLPDFCCFFAEICIKRKD